VLRWQTRRHRAEFAVGLVVVVFAETKPVFIVQDLQDLLRPLNTFGNRIIQL